MRFPLERNSIRTRLVVQMVLIAAILSLAFFLLIRAVADRAAQDTQDNILAASATAIADSLNTNGQNVGLELPYAAISMLGAISEDRVFYRVEVADETLTGYDDLPSARELETPSKNVFRTYEYRGESVRAVSVLRRISLQSRPVDVIVTVAQTQLGLVAISSRITSIATAVAAGFFLAAMGLSLLAAQSALSPLVKMTQAVKRRGPNDLRPFVTDTPSELVPLVEALNSFISRLRFSLSRSEDFIAEAAHRVRTPLATVRAQAEITHRRLNKPEHKKAIQEMIRAIDESSRSAGQLLDHAMVTFRMDRLERKELNLVDLVQETCDRLEPTADLRDIGINRILPVQQMNFVGDRVLLVSAFWNILDNALKYSPDYSEITVGTELDTNLVIYVSDQGRGFGNTNIADLTQRFSRGSNVDDVVGSGLGLTIADEVLRAHGGHIEIKRNENGDGACVSLILPRS